MNNLKINGLTTVGDMTFHEIEGGFGKGKKAMLVKEIAEIHGQPLGEINRRINDNRKRFVDGLDIVDAVGTEFVMALAHNEIYTQNAINRSTNIYILSERGYAKLLKILEDDLAWEKYDQLVDGYFSMREHIKQECFSAADTAKIEAQKERAHAMLLNAQTRMYTTIMKTIENKKLSPIAAEVFGLTALEAATGKKVDYRPTCEMTYSATEVGARFGVTSQRIGKLANQYGMKTDEYGITVMDKSRYSAKEVPSFRYNEKAIDRFAEILKGSV